MFGPFPAKHLRCEPFPRTLRHKTNIKWGRGAEEKSIRPMVTMERKKSIGATMRGMTVMAKNVARQRVCSERVGYLIMKYQPMRVNHRMWHRRERKRPFGTNDHSSWRERRKGRTWKAPDGTVLVVTVPNTEVKMKETSRIAMNGA